MFFDSWLLWCIHATDFRNENIHKVIPNCLSAIVHLAISLHSSSDWHWSSTSTIDRINFAVSMVIKSALNVGANMVMTSYRSWTSTNAIPRYFFFCVSNRKTRFNRKGNTFYARFERAEKKQRKEKKSIKFVNKANPKLKISMISDCHSSIKKIRS